MPLNQEKTVWKWSQWWNIVNGIVWHELIRWPLTTKQGNPKMGSLHYCNHTLSTSHPSLQRVKGNHRAYSHIQPTIPLWLNMRWIPQVWLPWLISSPNSYVSSDMKHPICTKKCTSILPFPHNSSPDHVVASTSLCLGMVRLHPQPCFPKQEKHPCPSNLFMLQYSCPHNPPNQDKSSTHLLPSSHRSATQHLRWVWPTQPHSSNVPTSFPNHSK